MKDIMQRIDKANHVVLVAQINPSADSLGAASAMYTHLLRLHKKVSFFCATKNIHSKLSFLPWSEKIRNSFPSSADFAIYVGCENDLQLEKNIKYCVLHSEILSTSQMLYNFFAENEITFNKKMATALYAGLLEDTNGFLSDTLDGTIFAAVKVLIEAGAEFELCNKYIMQYQSLSSLKLKALMLNNMRLINDAKVAVFLVSDEDMKKTGAMTEDCENALREALFLPTVELSLLVKENKDKSISGFLYTSTQSKYKSKEVFSTSNTYTLENALEEILKLIHKEI
jgi:bifunctional oligoribonuclease and PAP phosphatase NrnA